MYSSNNYHHSVSINSEEGISKNYITLYFYLLVSETKDIDI